MVSHAMVRQAVILAGGQGSRLKPYTDTVPKPMIEIAGRCIIDHQIEWLAEAGVTDVVVSAGHLHEVLIEHLSVSGQPVRVATVVEGEPLGRGGGLKYAGKYLPAPGESWFALNGGVYVFSSEILDLLPDTGDHERSTFPLLAKQRRLAGFPIEGYWRAIDTAKDIREAAKELGASGA